MLRRRSLTAFLALFVGVVFSSPPAPGGMTEYIGDVNLDEN